MWIIITTILTGLCYASLLYLFNKSQHYGKALTTTLFILRAVVVGLLFLLFFNPYIKKKTNKIEPATIIIISIIAALISNFMEITIVQHALAGINVAVCMLMINAIMNLWNKSVKNIAAFTIFATALVLSLFTNLSTVYLVIISGVLGVVFSKAGWIKNG